MRLEHGRYCSIEIWWIQDKNGMHNMQVSATTSQSMADRLTRNRARHVKCDEAKPHCSRCVKAGRKCEGYVSSPPKRRSPDRLTFINYAAPNSRSVSPYPQSDSSEVRALQYFKTCTAPQLAGSFSPDLWLTHMLRLAHHQSSVHHALVALGTAHEEFANPLSNRSEFSDYATREYGKAIHEVVQLNSSRSSETVEIALATCIIFSCLESLRGHYMSSLSHLVSGLNVLEEEQRQPTLQPGSCLPRELLLGLFLRMDSQRMDIGGAGTIPGKMLSILAPLSIPACFSSLNEAWLQLDILYHKSMQLMYRADEALPESHFVPTTELWQSMIAEKQSLEELRQCWENALSMMQGWSPGGEPSFPRNRPPGRILLDMTNIAIKIVLDMDLINPESDFDRYNDEFRVIVSDAEEYIQRTSEPRSASTSRSPTPQPFQQGSSASPSVVTASPPSSQYPKPLLPKPDPIPLPIFTLSLGCVSNLYFAAARCRNTAIRHRALDLLRRCNRREGLWDSTIAAHVAANVIAIEESNTLQATQDVRRDKSARSPRLSEVVIPEASRVKTVDLKFGPEAKGKAMYSLEYTMRPTAPQKMVPSGMDTSRMADLFEW